MFRNFALIFGIGVLAAACGQRYALKEMQNLKEHTWAYADSLHFQAKIQDTSRLYDIALVVKHQQDYGFQNLYLRIHTGFPGGKSLSQVLSLELADKAGKWKSSCRGKQCRLLIPIQHHAYFDESGTYQFTLEQFMRVDALNGISGLGLQIKDAGPR